MTLCCVHSCLFPGKRFAQFPLKDATLFQQWLERINNPQLFLISPKNVYRCHKVCERHFEETQLRKVAYPDSNQLLLIPGACPTLFLNEVVKPRKEDIPHILGDHTDSSIEVDAQSDPTTVVEVGVVCVRAELDNNPDLFYVVKYSWEHTI